MQPTDKQRPQQAQAQPTLSENVRVIHADDLKVLLAEAAEEGARRALASVGLHDEDAGVDVKELRGLLDAWRETKKTALKTTVSTATKILLGLLLFGMAVKLKFWSP